MYRKKQCKWAFRADKNEMSRMYTNLFNYIDTYFLLHVHMHNFC